MNQKVRHLSNIFVGLLILWLINYAWATWGSQPIIYCTVMESRFVHELSGLYSMGLILLTFAVAFNFYKNASNGVTVLLWTALYAVSPAFFKTLFSLGHTCLGG